MSENDLIQIACAVISKADGSHPADAVLRFELGGQRRMDPPAARYVTEAVFRYYRWYRWLDLKEALPEQVRSAYGLQERFDVNPATFPDSELLEKAVPDWPRLVNVAAIPNVNGNERKYRRFRSPAISG